MGKVAGQVFFCERLYEARGANAVLLLAIIGGKCALEATGVLLR